MSPRKPASIRNLHDARRFGGIRVEGLRLEKLLQELVERPFQDSPVPRLFRLGSLSERLDIPRSSLREFMKMGKLRGTRIFSRYYFTEDAVMNFLNGFGIPEQDDR